MNYHCLSIFRKCSLMILENTYNYEINIENIYYDNTQYKYNSYTIIMINNFQTESSPEEIIDVHV